MCVVFLFGAWTFVYVCLNMAAELEDLATTQGVLQLVRSSLVLGSVLMLFGPLLVFTPNRKIYVKSRIMRAVVKAAHKKETRYVSFAIFGVVIAAQVISTESSLNPPV